MTRYVLSALVILTAASCNGPQPAARTGDSVAGTYSGPFLGSPLEIEIREQRGDSVFGQSRHKDQVRSLTGTKSTAPRGHAITLWEPGDSPYDGIFQMELDTGAGTLKGSWKPKNNPGLSETAFELKRFR